MLVEHLTNWDQNISEYLNSLQTAIRNKNYTEHTHRPALKILLEKSCPKILATNEPKRIECGAPDYIISHGSSSWGYIEAKDIGSDLDEIQDSEQLTRYRKSLSNLILTDYFEFRWFVEGKLREPIVRIANLSTKGKVEILADGLRNLNDLLLNFLNTNVKTIKDSKELAERLATLARTLETAIRSAYALEDEDDEGKQAKEMLAKLRILNESKIMLLNHILDKPNQEMTNEDIFPEQYYFKFVQSTYQKELQGKSIVLDKRDSPIVKRIKIYFQKNGLGEFHKSRPARAIIKEFATTNLSTLPPQLIANLEKIISAINKIMASETSNKSLLTSCSSKGPFRLQRPRFFKMNSF